MKQIVGVYGTALAGVALCIALTVFARHFATASNLLAVLKQSSFLTILAVGFTFALITAELDLSFASLCSLAAVVTGAILYARAPVPLAILAGIGIGIAGGALNGILVTAAKIPSLITTLGTASVTGGLAFMMTNGVAFVGHWDDAFLFLARGAVLGVPMLVIITAAVVLASLVLSLMTRTGVHMRATGEAREAARRAGIAVGRMKFLGLTLSGAAAGVTAVLLVANLSSAAPQMAGDFLLQAIAAVLLGMTMFLPGRANVLGSFVGALIITVLGNGLVLLGAPYFLQDIALGVIIIASVGLSASVLTQAAFSL